MTPLAARLAARIVAAGPMTLADYMAACLMDPDHGYYATREPFGRAGDFVTAPEISQMFGELTGLALAQAWLDQGAPARFTLAELGPGRGTLMVDLLRATRSVPGFHAAARLCLVEASRRLRAVQAERLAGVPPEVGPVWCDGVSDLPEAPLFLIANEFFDALPIRQFLRQPGGWAERMVGLADGRLAFGLAPPAPLAALAHRLADTRPGDVVELCPAAPAIVSVIADRIARYGGAALIVDYGGWHSLGDTLQALHRGAPDDPLAHPGAADLTAHVDFEPLAAAARAAGAAAGRPTPQGVWLSRLGIDMRAERLARDLVRDPARDPDGTALALHRAAHRRLTDHAEMGTLFQVLAVFPRHGPPPPGVDA